MKRNHRHWLRNTGEIGLLLLALLLMGCPPAVDLSVTNVEVTQGIQTTSNNVPLVAQRSTAVRATLGISGGSSVSGITGALHVFVNGAEITPVAGVAPINAPFTAPATPQRDNENHTLNFELLAPTGISASADVDVRVDITPVAGETNTANNSGAANNLTFATRITPALYFTRIDWTPSGLGLPALTAVQAGRGDAFVRGIYPVNDGDPNLYRQGLFPTLTFTDDGNNNNSLELNPEGNNLLSFLASCRQLIVNAGLGASNRTFLYGWVAGNPINGNGWAPIGGFVAFGNVQDIRYQRTYAHELTHNFGLDHNSTTLSPETGWDVGARLPGNPAGNNTTGRVKPSALNDIMVGGQLTNSAWITVDNYNFLLNSASINTMATASASDDLTPRVLIVQGTFNAKGDSLVYLEPVFRYPWPSQATPRQQTGRYVVEVIDEAGAVVRTQFDARVADDAQQEVHGFFEVMVAVSPNREANRVRILSTDGQRMFGEFRRTQPPTIRIISPEAGTRLGDSTRVAWEANDPDTPKDELMFQLAYSPDAGRGFVPIGVDVRGASFVFSSKEIQRSESNGVIRVFVSDGLNTAFAEVRGLRAVNAQY